MSRMGFDYSIFHKKNICFFKNFLYICKKITMARKIRKGFILKSDFCKKYNIKISNFNETLLEKGFLKNNLISTELFSGKKKYAYGIADKSFSIILPLHGSNQQGVFQYSEKFLKEIFEIT